jgi:hypothetical protein
MQRRLRNTHPVGDNWTDLAVATYTAQIVMHGTPAIDQASNDIHAACPTGAEAALATNAGHRASVYRFDRSLHGFAPIFCHLSPDRLKEQLANN